MDVKAIVVAGPTPAEIEHPSAIAPALSDVLGKPVIFRVVENLRAHNIQSIAVVTDVATHDWPLGTTKYGAWTHASTENLWRAVEQSFADLAHGTDIILLVRVGAYAEINFSDFLQFHLDHHHHLTSARDGFGNPLDTYAISASRRNDAAYLIRHQLREVRTNCGSYLFNGYVNPLNTAHDLRTLAVDGLMQRAHIMPAGEELRPGVWVGRGAHIHRRARVLSPAFIGAGARVRAAAVVTRCTSLEHHTVVDCGTVVENVTTLPYTYLGAGLDVTHAVVGHRRLWSLKHNVEVEFADSTLVGEAQANAPLRTLGSLVKLTGFLPAQLLRGILAPSHREDSASLPEAIQAPSAALDAPAPTLKATAPSVDAGEFPANLVIARRYGNE